jgi:hypothetical protein
LQNKNLQHSFTLAHMHAHTEVFVIRWESVFVLLTDALRVSEDTFYFSRQQESNYIPCECRGTNMLQTWFTYIIIIDTVHYLPSMWYTVYKILEDCPTPHVNGSGWNPTWDLLNTGQYASPTFKMSWVWSQLLQVTTFKKWNT